MDASVLMDRDDIVKAWPNKKDSDIAGEVFQTYGLTPQVTDTEVIHDEEVSTIIQRETDIRFLRRLASATGTSATSTATPATSSRRRGRIPAAGAGGAVRRRDRQ